MGGRHYRDDDHSIGGYFCYEGKGKEPWTEEEDNRLVDALMELHVSGKYVYAPIDSGYVAAVKGLMYPYERHPDNFYSANSIRYRMKNIQIEFYLVHEMVAGLHRSRFSWDSETSCVIAGDQVWDEYIKSHPLAAQFRTKPFPHYNKLCTIFATDTTMDLQGDGNNLFDKHVELKVANQGSNAANDIMGKVATVMKDLPSLTIDERLIAMSVIGRSEPLSVMFDQLDEEGKVRMAQMVAVGAIN